MKLIAIHYVEHIDIKTKKPSQAAPEHPFEVDDEVGEKLKAMKAARDPTDAELALYAMKSVSREKLKAAFDSPAKSETKSRSAKAKTSKSKSAKEDDVV